MTKLTKSSRNHGYGIIKKNIMHMNLKSTKILYNSKVYYSMTKLVENNQI